MFLPRCEQFARRARLLPPSRSPSCRPMPARSGRCRSIPRATPWRWPWKTARFGLWDWPKKVDPRDVRGPSRRRLGLAVFRRRPIHRHGRRRWPARRSGTARTLSRSRCSNIPTRFAVWRSARTASSSPAIAKAACTSGRSTRAEPAGYRRSNPARFTPWRSRPTAKRWPPPAATRSSASGMPIRSSSSCRWKATPGRSMASRFNPSGERLASAGWDGNDPHLGYRQRASCCIPGTDKAATSGRSPSRPTERSSPPAAPTAPSSIWDADTGKLLATYLGHKTSVHTIAFNHDGSLLASGGRDGAVRIWRIDR